MCAAFPVSGEHALRYIWRGSSDAYMHVENANISMTHILELFALAPVTL